jgi:fumarylacetoacetase
LLERLRKSGDTQPMIDETHDPALTSWVCPAGHAEFPIQNLPFGVFSHAGGEKRAGVAIGDFVFDLAAAAHAGPLTGFDVEAVSSPCLNALFAWDNDTRRQLRQRLSVLLSQPGRKSEVEPFLAPANRVTLHCPMAIGDYTDFYAGIHHATNVGRLFRPDNPLLPNYKYVPIGYHGRASSVRASGAPVTRPTGQRKGEEPVPQFGPSRRLDFELELGIWIGSGNKLGTSIPIGEARNHIAGFCLLNDWSARDLQAWEYQPLGPFLAKNFLTTISPWIVTAEALEPFRVAQAARPEGDPPPLDYLWDDQDQEKGASAIDLEVHLLTAKMRAADAAPQMIARTSSTYLYWTPAQLVAHHASNGCNLTTGDLLGSGTISGPERGTYGSLLEISAGGREPLALTSGESRSFLEDGDEVFITGRAKRDGYVTIGFGDCRGVVVERRQDVGMDVLAPMLGAGHR